MLWQITWIIIVMVRSVTHMKKNFFYSVHISEYERRGLVIMLIFELLTVGMERKAGHVK